MDKGLDNNISNLHIIVSQKTPDIDSIPSPKVIFSCFLSN